MTPNGGSDWQDTADPAAEQALIGAALQLPHPPLADLVALIAPHHFHNPHHGTIWTAITARAALGQKADPVLIAGDLAHTGQLKPAPHPLNGAYLHTCLGLGEPSHATAYAHQILQNHQHTALKTLHARLGHTLTATTEPAARNSLTADIAQQLLDTIATTPGTPTADTWTPLDLGPALAGGTLTPPPVLLARTDGIFLLYLGRIHTLAGPPESGKSWFALIAVAQALHDGQHVIYIDFEDTPEGIVGRLLALGANPDHIATRLHYIRPDRAIDTAGRAHLAQLIADHFTTLVIIDGVTEAMTMHGHEIDDNADASKFYETLPRHITRQPNPPAVLLIDHVAKSEDRNRRYALGAQHKLAGLDGVGYIIDIVRPFAPGTPGISRIYVAKDRHGQVRKHARPALPMHIIADLHVDGSLDEIVVVAELRPPLESSTGTDGHWRPTLLMEAVSKWLEVHPGATQNDIETAVRGRKINVRAAVDALVAEEYVRREPGERRSQHHYSVKPFRQTDGDDTETDTDDEPPMAF